MFIIKIILIIVEIISSLLLIVVVLMQKSSSGGGLGMAFGAEMGESLFGARAGNVLTKATIWLTVIFLLNTTILAKIYTRTQSRSLMDHARPSVPVQQAAPPIQPGTTAPITMPSPVSRIAPQVQPEGAPSDVSVPAAP